MDTWATVSNLATGAGTLVLAVATFAAVRSSNRSARIAEEAFLQQLRPVIVHSGLEDARQKIMFAEGHWVSVEGGGAVVEAGPDVVYLSISLRNVGPGLAVLQSWLPWAEARPGQELPDIDQFRPLTRDLYIPAGGTGLWQGALRDPSEPIHAPMREAATERRTVNIDLLYTDHVGGQRTITRFSVVPAGDQRWLTGVTRHWNLDRTGPRGADAPTRRAGTHRRRFRAATH